MAKFSLESLTATDLLALHGDVARRLRELGICRSSNNPVADYAEWLCARALNLQLLGNSTASYDAVDANGRRYEIKARRQGAFSRPTHLSAIRGLPDQHFDFLVAILFNEDYAVERAVLLPFIAVSRLARYRKHVNGSYVYLRDVWECPEAQDVTPALRGV